MVMCRGHGADLLMAQLMPLPLTITCCSKSRLVLPFMFLPFWCRFTRVVLGMPSVVRFILESSCEACTDPWPRSNNRHQKRWWSYLEHNSTLTTEKLRRKIRLKFTAYMLTDRRRSYAHAHRQTTSGNTWRGRPEVGRCGMKADSSDPTVPVLRW